MTKTVVVFGVEDRTEELLRGGRGTSEQTKQGDRREDSVEHELTEKLIDESRKNGVKIVNG